MSDQKYNSLDTLADASETCGGCGGEIKMMSHRGTGFCSENCKDNKEPYGVPRRNHNTSGKPAPQIQSQTF